MTKLVFCTCVDTPCLKIPIFPQKLINILNFRHSQILSFIESGDAEAMKNFQSVDCESEVRDLNDLIRIH